MKVILVMALMGGAVFLYLHSCVQAGPETAITEPIANMEAARDTAEDKAGRADLKVYQDAVDNFKTAEERLPTGFQELKEKGYVSDIPSDLSFDPETGRVSRK